MTQTEIIPFKAATKERKEKKGERSFIKRKIRVRSLERIGFKMHMIQGPNGQELLGEKKVKNNTFTDVVTSLWILILL